MKPQARKRTRGGNNLDVLTHSGLRHTSATTARALRISDLVFLLQKKNATSQLLMITLDDKLTVLDDLEAAVLLHLGPSGLVDVEVTDTKSHAQNVARLRNHLCGVRMTAKVCTACVPKIFRHNEPR